MHECDKSGVTELTIRWLLLDCHLTSIVSWKSSKSQVKSSKSQWKVNWLIDYTLTTHLTTDWPLPDFLWLKHDFVSQFEVTKYYLKSWFSQSIIHDFGQTFNRLSFLLRITCATRGRGSHKYSHWGNQVARKCCLWRVSCRKFERTWRSRTLGKREGQWTLPPRQPRQHVKVACKGCHEERVIRDLDSTKTPRRRVRVRW